MSEHNREPVERRASERAAYLKRTTNLTDREAEALAYSELGFSYRGVAKRIDSTASTVQTYLERAAATYGPHVAGSRTHFEVDIDLEPVEPGDTGLWMRDTQERWFALVERYPDRAPDWYGGSE
jgi:DNA-binding CsgD family transcriptional regulator